MTGSGCRSRQQERMASATIRTATLIAGSLPEALKPFDLLSFGENPIIANTITTNQHRQTDRMKLTARFRNYQKNKRK